MRTVYLGTSEFAAVVLRRLAASPHRPELAVTRPDRPRGRGRKLSPPPVADAARELGIPLDQPASVNAPAAVDTIARARPDVVVVCAFGALITEPLLSRWEMLNVHPSLLPRWRGAAPIERAIMSGDDVTGVSIMRVGAGFDDGPVCAEESDPIRPDDTYGTLAGRLEELGADLLVRTLDERPPCEPQDEALAIYAGKITPEERELDPSRTALELERVVRALTPHIGAFVVLGDGSRLGVRAARAVDGDAPPPGTVSFDGPVPVLGCAEGVLELLEVQPPGGRPMSGQDYLRGHRR
ncbi:MAG TPA: methionyl-tRNA formyltransferase [Solirubrobacteraceae bacterium]|nr:methionyl-tRNA formyltransferase [Solirubrobacteraceae bacterium]